MSFSKRLLGQSLPIALSAAFLFGTAAAGPALAQSYPTRPVHLYVPYPAGGPNDVIARLVADGWEFRELRLIRHSHDIRGGQVREHVVGRYPR